MVQQQEKMSIMSTTGICFAGLAIGIHGISSDLAVIFRWLYWAPMCSTVVCGMACRETQPRQCKSQANTRIDYWLIYLFIDLFIDLLLMHCSSGCSRLDKIRYRWRGSLSTAHSIARDAVWLLYGCCMDGWRTGWGATLTKSPGRGVSIASLSLTPSAPFRVTPGRPPARACCNLMRCSHEASSEASSEAAL